ncbi:MAG: hypothetical protein QG583_346 [Patescibacteria group bacterium]|nr:hypothetical protein [Patescibacteria group bacterium]
MFNQKGKIVRNVFLLIIVVVILLLLQGKRAKDEPIVPDDEIPKNVISLCFYKKDISPNGPIGKYTLRMNLAGDKVDGELKFLPAEKDFKVGKFVGSVSKLDQMLMGRRISAMWDTMAEGMNTTEELKIIFGEGTADVGFGEMSDRGDGVYVYKNPEAITYSLDMSDVACDDLVEIENVEAYLKKNISTLSPIKAVLGGTWYVLYADINTSEDTGIVTYEDGHIQEKKNFSYTLDATQNIVNLSLK